MLPTEDVTRGTILFLENRVKQDPDDTVAQNKLCGYYMQRGRETGDVKYYALAEHAARASLAALPAEQNIGGLAALARVEFATHDFAGARRDAQQLTELEPARSLPYLLLFDPLVELGEYDKAADALRNAERRGGNDAEREARQARLSWLRGETDAAIQHFTNGLAFMRRDVSAPRESVAWFYWQAGDAAFAAGRYDEAERKYADALAVLPDYFHALASLGRVRAAKGDTTGAIDSYERSVNRFPDPASIAALGDLYHLAGRGREAAAQYALVEHIARLSATSATLYNRQLALFYADHDLKADIAYALAAREYETRRDVYGADTLAWTALKAGKLAEAQAASKEALKLNTLDAKFLYHAGMIAHAARDRDAARNYLSRALALSPAFDTLQARIAQTTLAE